MQVVYDPVLGSLRTSDATGSALTAAPVSTDGSLKLDAASNLYTVKPSEAVAVTLDASGVGSSRFVLAFDFTAGAQTVTLPENFRWNGVAPAMSGKGIYTVDVVYISSGSTDAFSGTYLGLVRNPIDPNIGVVTYLDGELKEDLCGEEFNNLTIKANAGWDDDGNEFSETVIVDINPGSNITGELTLKSYEMSALTVNVKGGVVAKISSAVPDGALEFNMTSGVVEDVYWTSSGLGSVSFSMNGGTIGKLAFSELGGMSISNGVVDRMSLQYTYVEAATISGGTIGSCDVGDEGELSISAGTIGEISLTGSIIEITVSGGYVGLIESTSRAYECNNIYLSGCTVGRLIAYTAADYDPYVVVGDNVTLGELRMHQYSNNQEGNPFAPNIGKNCRIDRLSFTHDFDIIDDVSSFSFSVGANSVVKLDSTMQELITAGVLTINADPTAQIINLED